MLKIVPTANLEQTLTTTIKIKCQNHALVTVYNALATVYNTLATVYYALKKLLSECKTMSGVYG